MTERMTDREFEWWCVEVGSLGNTPFVDECRRAREEVALLRLELANWKGDGLKWRAERDALKGEVSILENDLNEAMHTGRLSDVYRRLTNERDVGWALDRTRIEELTAQRDEARAECAQAQRFTAMAETAEEAYRARVERLTEALTSAASRPCPSVRAGYADCFEAWLEANGKPVPVTEQERRWCAACCARRALRDEQETRLVSPSPRKS